MGDIPRPTIRPANPFNCEADTKTLRSAMKGIGTDEKAIIQVIGHTSNKQRQEILIMFKTMYGKDLISDLKSELSGDLEELILALFKSTEYYDAWCLNKAMRGIGTKESILIEILTTRTNAEIRGIKAAYKQHFGRELEADCASETSGHFKRLLVSCCQANRTELTDSQRQMLMQRGPEAVVDRALAQQDAQTLYKAGIKKFGTDESAFLSVLSIRHENQMRATFEEYQKLSGKDILSSIGSEMSGDLEDGFKAIIMSAKNRPKFFSDKLYEAMRGMGTDDSTLIRIIVSRSEIDLQNIKDQYQRDHGKSLNAAVSSETSGDYKKLLLAIVGQ